MSELMRGTISSNRKSYQNTIMTEMASIAMLIGEALVNALAFTCNSYMFSKLSKDSINKERKGHDLAIEQLR